MDTEIIVKCEDELSEWYPKNYEEFQQEIGDLTIDMFPRVGGWWFSSELTEPR